MKKITLLFATACMLLATSCTDLKEEILNEQDGSSIVSDSKNAQMIVSPAYAYLRDLQSSGGVWIVMESLTDEVAFPTRGTDWNDVNKRTLFTHEYDSKNTLIRNTWNSFMIGIARTNIALFYLNKLEQTDEVKGYVAETKFIRSLCMYHLMDCFGQFPFREADNIDFATTKPFILDRPNAIKRITAELNEIIPILKSKGEVPYGRITKAAAQTLLAKLYLNYQVYTGTAPNFDNGTAKWNETIALCDEIINSGKYQLADDYWKLYLSSNEKYSDQTETILPIIYNCSAGIAGPSWLSNTLHYNQKFGSFKNMNNGCCTTPDFLSIWDTTDPRYQDNRLKTETGFNLGVLIGQQFDISGRPLYTRSTTPTLLIFTPEFSIQNSTEEQGARVVKYAPDPKSTFTGNSENDFQYYRISDIYLMRAEAKFRKGDATALADINAVRIARKVRTYTASELTLDKILNERAYEFYWDGPSRRNDLVRFGKYTKARYEKPESEAYKILLPIPLSAYEANRELKQNPGYESFK